MSIRAYIAEDHMLGRYVRVAFIDQRPTGEYALRLAGNTVEEIRLEEGTEVPDDVALTLSHDMARALLQSLTNHYHGAEDTRALRKDYDHEKQRVDKMIDHLIGGAR